MVRAPACHAGGRGFEPRLSRHFRWLSIQFDLSAPGSWAALRRLLIPIVSPCCTAYPVTMIIVCDQPLEKAADRAAWRNGWDRRGWLAQRTIEPLELVTATGLPAFTT
ncbi:putative membrane protein [Bradyrhizobium oligotrophicum S58]|uniref:Putative membrane protein n=1 Tax=Bradyrhizobium oligotrophicum S58 TaxID=1245469 RepID=M4Z7B3_9BRAD|nr:putative membrane protein [Bradyrhizobium oligotrophicum S58]